MSGSSINAPVDKVTADILADRLVTFRNGYDGIKGTKDDNIFTADIGIDSMLPELSTQLPELKKYFTTKSGYFRIESTGTVDSSNISKSARYIVKKDQTKGITLSSYREY